MRDGFFLNPPNRIPELRWDEIRHVTHVRRGVLVAFVPIETLARELTPSTCSGECLLPCSNRDASAGINT